MSRIEQAWARASGAAPDNGEGASPTERLVAPEAVLFLYPREVAGAQTPPTVDRPGPRTIAAPRTDERRQLGQLHPHFERKLVVSRHAAPLAVEQYRRLAGAVHELQVEQGLKTLMVTSTLPKEGKTLTAANLALTLSESCERRVLLIDADLRRPMIHEVFRLPNARGLSDALSAARGATPLLQVSAFLSIMPAGQPAEPMALASDQMRVLLDQSAATFDWVVIDAPAVGFMPDAQLLAHLIRAVVFVIAAHSTPHALVSRAIAELGPECVIGTVLNRVEESDIPAAGCSNEYGVSGHQSPAD